MTGGGARRPRGRRGRPLLLVLLLALAALVLWRSLGEQPLELVFLDVGQGDAVFIRTPEGRTALIDGGKSGGRLMELLAALRVDELDLVVASHADFDHIGGLVTAVAELPVGAFMDNGVPHTTQTYRRLLDEVERSGARYLQATPRTVTLGSAELVVLPPPLESDEQNDNSVGLLLRYGGFEALLTGDSPTDEQMRWLAGYRELVSDVDVYKAAHHGSATGDEPEWLRVVSPDVVVIQLGADNPYGHPHREPLTAYREVGATVYRTDEDGSVTVTVPAGGVGGVETISVGDVGPAGQGDLLGVLEALLSEVLRVWASDGGSP